jgi:formylglycine-generating enzyme required for sulfatase activity
MSQYVFVSYSSQDKPTADAVCATLESRGIHCWIAPRDVTPGEDWAKEIIRAISGCRVMVLVFSSHSNYSRQVCREVQNAFEMDRTVIPLRVEVVAPVESLKYYIGPVHWLDALTPPLEQHLELLATTVERFLAAVKPAIAPTAPGIDNALEAVTEAAPTIATSLAVAEGDRRALPREPKVISNSIGMKLVLIPAGEFLMGSPDSDPGAKRDEKPQHWVRITQPFSLGVTPVTQSQYRAVTGTSPSHFHGSDDLPVEQVSWDDAIEFCNKLSEREGLEPFGHLTAGVRSGGDGYRLPTEAEWEYACRAGSSNRFHFGEDEAILGEYAWFAGNSESKTNPLGQKHPNPWGLYDMHGNVWEWCRDWYKADYFHESPESDPLGPLQASLRVYRGGCWGSLPRGCRAADRGRDAPADRGSGLGFRVARVPSGQ